MNTKFVTALSVVLLTSACNQAVSNSNDLLADNDTRVCRDNRGFRTDDSRCRGGFNGSSAFMWYYIGRGQYIPPIGSSFSNNTRGSYTPVKGASYFTAPKIAPASAVTRGGFGSSSHASSFSSGS